MHTSSFRLALLCLGLSLCIYGSQPTLEARAEANKDHFTMMFLEGFVKGNKVQRIKLRRVLWREALKPMHVKSMYKHELRRLRNAIFAVDGARFRSPELSAFFYKQSWYRGKKSATQVKLTAQAVKNMRFLLAQQKKAADAFAVRFAMTHLPQSLRAQKAPQLSKAPAGPGLKLDVSKISNLKQFGKFLPIHYQALNRQGFTITPSKFTHFFELYEQNDYLRIPSYITTDVVIDMTHHFMESVLRSVEAQYLAPQLRTLSMALMQQHLAHYNKATNPTMKQSAARNTLFFAVPAGLLGAKVTLPKVLQRGYKRTLQRVVQARGKGKTPGAPNKLNFTKFKVRGHYTRSPILQRYFRAMSWMGMVAWSLHPSKGNAQDIAFLIHALRTVNIKGRVASAVLQDIVRIQDIFVGASDATTPAQLVSHHKAAFGSGPFTGPLLQAKRVQAFAATLAQMPAPQVPAHRGQKNAKLTDGPQLRFMGQRAFADTLYLKHVSAKPGQRVYFSGMDVLAGLGSLKALQLLKARDPQVRKWAGYDKGHRKGMIALKRFMTPRQGQDVYHGTLHALKALIHAPTHKMLPASRTPGWTTRLHQSFLGGWAELRHDTILYGSQLGAECAAPSYNPPAGAVEPYPAVYRRLRAMVKRLESHLKRVGVLPKTVTKKTRLSAFTRSQVSKFGMMSRLLQFCERIARKHRKGQKLTAKDKFAITTFGGSMATMMVTLSEKEMLSNRDRDMAVIADIATLFGKAVEVGVGRPDTLYVVVNVEGKWTLMRGGTFAYYEFLQPGNNRLTDESWRKKLSSQSPVRPAWFRTLVTPAKPKIPKPKQPQSRCPGNFSL